MKRIIILILIIAAFAEAQLHRLSNVAAAERANDKYFVWVYFTNKDKRLKKSNISQKTLQRRTKAKANIDFDWYDANPSENYIDKVLETGAKLRQQSRWLNAISIECNKEQLNSISYMPFIKELNPVKQYRKKAETETQIQIDILAKSKFISEIDYGNAKGQIEQINVHKAHEAGYFGQGVTVLMLDTGFNLEHPVFDSLNVIAEWDVINNDSLTRNEGSHESPGQHNHGTGTFSTLGGYSPGLLVGPAYKANFLLAKTEILDKEIVAEEDNFIAALEWGESRGSDIMSSSLGYTDWYTWEDMDGNTALTTIAVDIAVDLGMICVTSAGNENNNSWGHIIAPADADNVISVGAVDNKGLIAGFSSRGPSFDERIKPEVCALGVSAAIASGNGVSFVRSNGTSFSAPLVAGAAAVLLSAHPDWTPIMVRQALLETASQANNPNNDFGWGIVDTWDAINFDPIIASIPEKFELHQNYPNPFNSLTTIKYSLEQSKRVKLKIYDVLGREISTLVDKFESSGNKSVQWSGKDASGNPIGAGVYIYKLIVGETSISKKMVYLK